LFLLRNVVLKCLALCLITICNSITAACFPHLYACLTCSSVYASYLFTHCLPTIVCVISNVDVYSVFFYFCYMLHFFVTPFWLVCAHIFSFIFIFVSFHAIATILYCHLPYGFSMLFASDLILFLKFLMVLA